MAIRIGIVGFGKIARDEHAPAIAADPRFELVAVTSTSADPKTGAAWFKSPAEMFEGMSGRMDAVAVCTPPLPRHGIARDALLAGFDVLLEKPPAATLGEVEHLGRLARQHARSLFAAWHSQYAPAVAKASAALADRRVAGLTISWLEDVRKYHPGQEWIWAAGGFGVFDTGINAFSIATRILPMPLFVREATLIVPTNKQAPIAAKLTFAGQDMRADLDWRFVEGEEWRIHVRTEDGLCVELCDGGSRLLIDGVEQQLEARAEYPALYGRFAELIDARASNVDREPLRIVADAFMVGRREPTEPFL